MSERSYIVGRDASCHFVICDPKRRVSRQHAQIDVEGQQMLLTDLGSLNGTYLNGKRLPGHKPVPITYQDKVTLSSDYVLDLQEVVPPEEDKTLILKSPTVPATSLPDATLVFNSEKAIFRDQGKTIVIDRNKTELGEILQNENTPFVTVGRSNENRLSVDDPNISRVHCRLRLLTPMMIEVEDLGSTNGTFADGEQLKANQRYQFDTAVTLQLGKTYRLNLKELFPQVSIVQKKIRPQTPATAGSMPPGSAATPAELQQFSELESIWKEFLGRQNQANSVSTGYGIGGAVAGLAAAAFTGLTGGVGGLLLMSGGGVLGRYLGQQASSKIRNDLTYEDAFLEAYCCPRCQESFQKKPWITIRECFKCKIKLR